MERTHYYGDGCVTHVEPSHPIKTVKELPTEPAMPPANPIGPCAVSRRRALMTDSEFWEDVQNSMYPSFDEPDLPEHDVTYTYSPCGVCGEHGACGYDNEGRPMIHAEGLESGE